jgi:elongation factor P
MPNAGELRRGGRVEIDGDPYVVLDVHFQSPSARGAATLVKTKVRNLRTGSVFDRSFKAQDRVVEPQVALRPVQYLYADDAGYHFMDSESYEQFALSADDLGDAAGYLLEGLGGIRSVLHNDRVISIELPQTIVLRVQHTDPAIKGATAQAQTKAATLETGLVIQVPAYLESGELVQVDTREARFIGRAKDKGG